jgi:hypothetical protein
VRRPRHEIAINPVYFVGQVRMPVRV